MTEEEIKAAAVELAQAARAKGLVLARAIVQIDSDNEWKAMLSHDAKGEGYAHAFIHGVNDGQAAVAIASLAWAINALPSEHERNTRAAVEALEAARLACEKIDADDVAASLAALVTRLSEDLIEHKEGAA